MKKTVRIWMAVVMLALGGLAVAAMPVGAVSCTTYCSGQFCWTNCY